MANLQKAVGFNMSFIGDGVNKDIVIYVKTDPIFFQGSGISPFFDVAESLPVGITNIVVSVGGTVTSTATYNALLGTITISLATAPTAGAFGNISGYFLYN